MHEEECGLSVLSGGMSTGRHAQRKWTQRVSSTPLPSTGMTTSSIESARACQGYQGPSRTPCSGLCVKDPGMALVQQGTLRSSLSSSKIEVATGRGLPITRARPQCSLLRAMLRPVGPLMIWQNNARQGAARMPRIQTNAHSGHQGGEPPRRSEIQRICTS